MIEVKTRKKIIKLKEEGYSNTEIKKRTGISLPTIRKIIQDHEGNSSINSIDYTYPIDVFIVNTTRAWPSRGTPLFQALRNGTAFWRLDAVLGTIFNPNIVQNIVGQIDYLGKYGVFQVSVKHKPLAEESVSVLLLEGDS